MIKKTLVGGERVPDGKMLKPSVATPEERIRSCFSKKANRGQEHDGRGQAAVETSGDGSRKTRLSGRGVSASRGRKTDSK